MEKLCGASNVEDWCVSSMNDGTKTKDQEDFFFFSVKINPPN